MPSLFLRTSWKTINFFTNFLVFYWHWLVRNIGYIGKVGQLDKKNVRIRRENEIYRGYMKIIILLFKKGSC